jgi:hypothetical protein
MKGVVLGALLLYVLTSTSMADVPTWEEFLRIQGESLSQLSKGELAVKVREQQNKSDSSATIEAQKNAMDLERLRSELARSNLPKTTIESNLRVQEKRLTAEVQKHSDFSYERKYYYDQKARDYRVDEVAVNEAEKAKSKVERSVITSRGGQVRYYPGTHQAVVDQFKSENPVDLPFDLGLVDPRRFPRGAPEAEVRTSMVDGAELVVYSLKDAKSPDKLLRIYADPTLGYCYRRVEFVESGKTVRSLVASAYKEFGGVFFPTHFVERIEGVSEDAPALLREIEVMEAKFGGELPKDIFKFQLPTGVFVVDAKLGVSYSLDEVGRSAAALGNTLAVDDIFESSVEAARRKQEATVASKSQPRSTEPRERMATIDGRRSTGTLWIIGVGVMGVTAIVIAIAARRKMAQGRQ